MTATVPSEREALTARIWQAVARKTQSHRAHSGTSMWWVVKDSNLQPTD